MITSEYLDKHFYNKFYNLDKESILRMNQAYCDPRINNVVTRMHSHCYGLALLDDSRSIEYHIYYINGDQELVGNLLKLDINDPERDALTIVFSMHLADTFNLDVLVTFNTFQDATRSMCEQLGYLTLTANELLPYKDKNATIVAKNVKGIIIVPFLFHADLYEFLFGPLLPINVQTGDSFVYLMHNKRNNLVKIVNKCNRVHREKTLQAEEPEITMVAVWKASDELERDLHNRYKHKRLRGEWFDLTFKELKEIKDYVDNFIAESTNR